MMPFLKLCSIPLHSCQEFTAFIVGVASADIRMACVCVGEVGCAFRVFARLIVPFPFHSQKLATQANNR